MKGSFEKNAISFGTDMSSSVHINNKGQYILILAERPTQGLDDTTLTADAKYPINFTQSGRRFVLSLHSNGRNSFLFVNATKIYQFKAKTSKIKDYVLYLGNISKGFTIDNMKKKTGLKRVAIFFSVDFNPIDTNDILDIYKYLMKRTRYKITFGIIRNMFIVLLSNIVNGSNHTKCVLLSNQKFMNQFLLIYILMNTVKNFTTIHLRLN